MTNQSQKINVYVPGSMMLMGEHAVLHSHPCLVAAIDKRIHFQLAPRNDQKIQICSQLGEEIWDLQALPKSSEKFSFILACVRATFEQTINKKKKIVQIHSTPKKLKSGFTLSITSDLSPKLGLGSSAAVVVGTLTALKLFLKSQSQECPALDLYELLAHAKEIVQEVQGGQGSGADLAASIFGGVIHYQFNQYQPPETQLTLEKVADTIPLVAAYVGYKEKTPDAIAKFEARRIRQPDIYNSLFFSIAFSIQVAIEHIDAENWPGLGHLFDIQQGMMNAFGLSNLDLETLTLKLRDQPGVFGAKISGAGFGDCIIGVGSFEGEQKLSLDAPQQVVDVAVSGLGLRYSFS